MIQIDTNAQIVEIGIELGSKRLMLNLLHDVASDNLIIATLDHCLELWLKYYELTKPLECYTFTFDNGKPKKMT